MNATERENFQLWGLEWKKWVWYRQGDKFYSVKRHVQRRLHVVTLHTSGFSRKFSVAFHTKQTRRLKFKQNN
jgi:hypothetical protein